MMHVDEEMLMEIPEWDVPSPPPAVGAKVGGGSAGKAEKKGKKKKRDRDGLVAVELPVAAGREEGEGAGEEGRQPSGKKSKKNKFKREGGGDAPPVARAAASTGSGGGSAKAKVTSHPGKAGGGQLDKKVDKAAKGGRGLLDKMRARLSGGRFRWLNEELYTQPGSDSFETMQRDPSMFEEYHAGFREQTADWPQQPVELCIKWLQARPRSLVVADFGCGDAQLMDSVPNKVHSLDLVSQREGVVACNLADVPMPDNSVDVVVFCLALMGTDYPAFLQEAARVLRPGGTVWIAEVRSRFTDPPGKEATLLVEAVRALGLVLKRRDSGNKMFIILELELKKKPLPQGAPWPELKACIYKRR